MKRHRERGGEREYEGETWSGGGGEGEEKREEEERRRGREGRERLITDHQQQTFDHASLLISYSFYLPLRLVLILAF